MSGSSMPTIETAPRDRASLAQHGVFVHRRLADALFDKGFKLWTNEREKAAFLTATPDARAAELEKKLKEFDGASPALPAAPPPPAPTPVVEEAAAAPPPVKRAPRTPAGAPPAAAPVAGAAPGVQELLNVIKALQADLASVTSTVASQADLIKGLTSSVGNTQTSLSDIKSMLAASMRVQHTQLGLLVLFGAQVLQAPMGDFIGVAEEDADKALSILEELQGMASSSGKG